MNSWWPFLGVLCLFFFGKPLLINILVFCRVRGFRLSAPKSRTVPREETGSGTAAVLGSIEAELEAVGFQFERAVLQVPPEGEAYQSVAWSYMNNDTCVRVSVRKLQLSAGAIPVCFFESLLEDGRLLVTSPSAARADSTEILRENQIDEMSVEAQYRAHLDFVLNNGPGQRSLLLAPDEQASQNERIWNESMRLRERRGQVFRVGEGQFAYTLREAARRSWAATTKVRKLNQSKLTRATVQKLASTSSATPSVEEEIEQYRQITQQAESSPLGALTKLILLLLSMGLFLLAFRLSFSWETLLILMGVLTFHEGGHLLGMRIFGYKNLQMLYLPFLGAVAIGGKREYVKPWQELVVLFLGPLPGFVIGVFVLMHPIFAELALRHELGFMLVGLNLFNMVPIHPLDGGQIWDILLFRRFPFGRVVFLGVGAIAMLSAGVFGVFGSAFVLLGVVLLVQLPNQIRQARMIHALRKQFGSPLSHQAEETLLPAIFGFLHKQSSKLKHAAKIAWVRGVLAQCKSDPAGPATFFFGLAAYSSPVWVALIALTAQNMHNSSTAAAELTNARTERLLDFPSEPPVIGRVDGTPLMLQIQKLVKTSDVDLKFQAIQRHASEPAPDWKELHKAITNPDVSAVLALAREVAEADYIKLDQNPTISMAEITQWLGLSAACAGGDSDANTAWADLEKSLRSVGVETETTASFPAMHAEVSLLTALREMQDVLVRLNPTVDEIARLRGLLAARRIAPPLLRERLSLRIATVKQLSLNNSNYNGGSILLRLFAPDIAGMQSTCLSEIRELKDRLKVLEANSNLPEEAVFRPVASNLPGANDFVLMPLRLAHAALAIEDYRLAHGGGLPTALSEVTSLTVEQQNMVSWNRETSQLGIKRIRNRSTTNGSSTAPFARTIADRDTDEDGSDERYSPYVWKVRPPG